MRFAAITDVACPFQTDAHLLRCFEALVVWVEHHLSMYALQLNIDANIVGRNAQPAWASVLAAGWINSP